MSEIKSTTEAQQLANALAAIAAANEEAKHQLDRQAAAAIRQLEEAHAAYVAIASAGDGGAFFQRAQHVFVAHFDPRVHGHLPRLFDSLDVVSQVTNYRIPLTSQSFYGSADPGLPGPRDCAYRVWVLFEPLETTKENSR